MKKIIISSIFIALIGIFACTNEHYEAEKNSFSQDGLEEWFNSTFKKSKEWTQNADNSNKTLDWSNGMSQKKDSLEVFEFPLMENNATISVPQSKPLTNRETQKILEGTISRIAIIKTNTNEMLVRKLYYVPDYEYLLSKGYDISDVMIGKINDDFTGLLITKNWNDNVLSCHKVKNGKIEEMLVQYNENATRSNFLNGIKMNNYATAKTSGLSDEQNLDEVVVINSYHATITYIYLPSQPYFPSTASSTYDPYGMGGGTSGNSSSGSSNNYTECINSLNTITERYRPASQLTSSTTISEGNSSRRKNYEWMVFTGPSYKIYSSDTGVHKKVVNSNPALQWEWVSLTHNSIYKTGYISGYDITTSTNYAQSTIGKYTSSMEVNFNVKFGGTIYSCFLSAEENIKTIHGFNVTD